MKYDQNSGWYLPDNETHLQEWMGHVKDEYNGRYLYQGHKYREAVKYCRHFGAAVDVGAHVGLWSWRMAHDFEVVHSFEPVPEHIQCLKENCSEYVLQHNEYRENQESVIILWPTALGNKVKTVGIENRTTGSSGDSNIIDGFDYNMKPLDDLGLYMCDFMKIDCEGYELFVIQGAVETLKRCKPVLIVEQKPETGMEERYGIGTTEAISLLEKIGYKVREVIQGDYILTWKTWQ